MRDEGQEEASFAEIFEHALEIALKQPRRTATSSDEVKKESVKNTPAVFPKKRPYISVFVRRQLLHRTGSRCAYISVMTGRRCNETKNLQVEHIVPFGKGGSSDLENLTLLCPQHNLLRAIEAYGQNRMKHYLRQ
jgi:5-methylcytosine-specific restriction endonuclease McrA